VDAHKARQGEGCCKVIAGEVEKREVSDIVCEARSSRDEIERTLFSCSKEQKGKGWQTLHGDYGCIVVGAGLRGGGWVGLLGLGEGLWVGLWVREGF